MGEDAVFKPRPDTSTDVMAHARMQIHLRGEYVLDKPVLFSRTVTADF